MDKTTKGYIIYKAVFYFILGALIILGSIALPIPVFVSEFNLRKECVTVEATVTSSAPINPHDDETDYKLRLSYEYDNKNYKSVIEKSNRRDDGDRLKIHIDPQNPEVNYGINQGLGDFLWPFLFSIPLFFVGVFLLREANSYRISLRLNAKVIARVSKSGIEICEDSDGRVWSEYCVYVDYEYNGKEYESIYWYGAETKNKTKRRLIKELSQFPQTGETFQLFINPQKPDKILSKAPFIIIN